jgi:hypothetical protein
MMQYPFFFFLFLSALWSCTASAPWKLEAIAAGEKNFNIARLKYSAAASPLSFEIVRLGDSIEAYLSLLRHHFTPSNASPSLVKVLFTIHTEQKEEWIPLHEGSMRLRVPQEILHEIIGALQKEEQVSILVDDFKQTLKCESFSKLYDQLKGSMIFLSNPIQGPLR